MSKVAGLLSVFPESNLIVFMPYPSESGHSPGTHYGLVVSDDTTHDDIQKILVQLGIVSPSEDWSSIKNELHFDVKLESNELQDWMQV